MFVESALVHGGLLNPMSIVFYPPWILKFPPEIWRLLSSFILTGGGFSFVFDLYFSTLPFPVRFTCSLTTGQVYTYASGLELNSPRFTQPGDFFTYVAFVATVILVGACFIFLLHPQYTLSSVFLLFSHFSCSNPHISARPVHS